ncbi:MAG: rRNA maturation RNase YbeY [Bacteroidota bacterium]|nr:rRNA maturation RNase YbeY [Bacteroidota bacterium]
MGILPSSNKIVFNSVNRRPGLNRSAAASWLKAVLVKEKKALNCININFCDDEYLLGINQEFLQHDYYTDIITFDLSDQDGLIEADIYISLDRVRENAKLLKSSADKELKRVMLHGLLHLCGYNDKTKGEIAQMRGKEELYLKLI